MCKTECIEESLEPVLTIKTLRSKESGGQLPNRISTLYQNQPLIPWGWRLAYYRNIMWLLEIRLMEQIFNVKRSYKVKNNNC